MVRRAIAAFFLCLAVSGICLANLPRLLETQTAYFAQTEKYFEYPILLRTSIAAIRRDSFGKGFFGASRDGGRTHEGVDLTVDVRMPIFAAKSGRILFAGQGKGYGKYIEIAHPDGRSTRYAHLSEICCRQGDWAGRGQVIGVSGTTGNAANPRIRPHLHFEIREQGKPLDPAGWMDPAVRMK